MAEFSSATQAVLDAFRTSNTGQGCLAAALRAAADHVLAAQWEGQIPPDTVHMIGINWARDALNAIASELEAQ